MEGGKGKFNARRWLSRIGLLVCSLAAGAVLLRGFQSATKQPPYLGFREYTVRVESYKTTTERSLSSEVVSAGVPAESGAGVVAGVVTSPEGAPVPSAMVFIVDAGESSIAVDAALASKRSGSTGSDGRFRLPLPGGEYPKVIHVRHGEYLPTSWELENARQAIVQTIEIRLERGAELSGRVTATDGVPLQGVRVIARGRGASSEMVRGALLPGADVEFAGSLSDASGAFTLKGLPWHELAIEAYAPGLRMIAPVDFHQRLIVAPGTALTISMEPVGVLHLLVIDGITRTPVKDIQVKILPVEADAAGFFQWSSNSHGVQPFSWGGPGSELSMAGIEPSVLPGGEKATGRGIIVGLCRTWPLPGEGTVQVDVHADGYLSRTVRIPVHPFEAYSLPEETEVVLEVDPGVSPKGGARIACVFSGEVEGGVPWRNVSLWRRIREGEEFKAPVLFKAVVMRGLSDMDNKEYNRQLIEVQKRMVNERLERVLVTRVPLDGNRELVLEGLEPGVYEFMEYSGFEGPTFEIRANEVTQVQAREVPVSIKYPPAGDSVVHVSVYEAGGKPIEGFGLRFHLSVDANGAPVEGARSGVLPVGSTLARNPLRLTGLVAGDYEVTVMKPGYVEQSTTFHLDGIAGVIECKVILPRVD